MAKKIGKYDIPFFMHPDGHFEMMEYVACSPGVTTKVGATYKDQGYIYGAPTHWVPTEPFEGDMELTGHWRGRSSARVGVRDVKTGTEYSMGFASFYDAVERGQYKQVDGKTLLTGRWQCRKQGANYILVPLEDGVA